MKILEKTFKNNNLSCDEELNILDIEDDILYSLDNKASMYIKIEPISFEYLSNSEKSVVVKRLSKEFVGERDVIKIITMSSPMSTSEVDRYLEQKRKETNNSFKRSMLLKQINDINKLSYKGEMIEKQVVIQLFGTVKIDFQEIEIPIVYVNVLDNLKNGFTFTNKTKISGNYLEEKIEDNADRTTIICNRKVKLNKELQKIGV